MIKLSRMSNIKQAGSGRSCRMGSN